MEQQTTTEQTIKVTHVQTEEQLTALENEAIEAGKNLKSKQLEDGTYEVWVE